MTNRFSAAFFSSLVLSVFIFIECAIGQGKAVVLETGNFRYEITSQGINRSFMDKATGVDYLFKDTLSYCAYVSKDGRQSPVTGVSMINGNLVMDFREAGVTAKIDVSVFDRHIKMKVAEVTGSTESFTFLNVPLSLEGLPDEPFAACALAMNPFTHVKQLPALQDHLWASCYQKFGITGAEIALTGLPVNQMLPEIREVMSGNPDLPVSLAGGAWAQLSPAGYGSYLMNHGSLTEQTADLWIQTCRSLAFNQISHHGTIDNFIGNHFFRFGDFELNREKWPQGWETFRKINQKLHDAGISSIFHTYAFFIDKNSSYVNPVPDPDLAWFSEFTLSEPAGPDDTVLTVNESTADISLITGWRIANSTTLRIGSELIEFSNITQSPPYQFTGCKRGALGTKAAEHASGDKAYHLKELFGLFLPGPETALFSKIARHTAEIVNKYNFDGIYLDAIDASHILDGEENAWYYGSKFILEIARHLEKPAGMEMSAMSHHWWHYRSRWQAWDKPTRGYKRFIDIHVASLKTDEYEHGHWKGNTPLIEKYGRLENGGLMLPLHLGWWGHQAWDPPQKEPVFTDDVEYLGCKMIGFNAGLSLVVGADETALKKYPSFRRLNEIIRKYEFLRQTAYFHDTIRQELRQPGKEFTLFMESDSSWNFKPVKYQKQKLTVSDTSPSEWSVTSAFDAQPAKLRIEPLLSAQSYHHPGNLAITGSENDGDFTFSRAAKGISGKLESCEEVAPDGSGTLRFSALSTGETPRDASWISYEKKFEPPINLENNQGLGVWVKGDGNGQLLCIRLLTPEHLIVAGNRDHFIRIDYIGWKYFELVESESSAFSDYVWPGTGSFNDLYVYQTYRNTVIFSSIDRIQFWYNNVPEGKSVNCIIGPVKAIPLLTAQVSDPSVNINGRIILFPVKMESGSYLEFNSMEDCKLYDKNGALLQEVVPTGNLPVLERGLNQVSLSCNTFDECKARLQVTVIGEGEALIKNQNTDHSQNSNQQNYHE